MILIVRKNNIILVTLILLLSVLLYSLNFGHSEASPVASGISSQRTVMLDPGHGGEDPGAVSDYSGILEKDINLYIANRVKELLEKDGYNIFMTRSEDRLEYKPGTPGYTEKREQDLIRRKQMMDESGADIVVSIHLNKFKETQYYGFQTFYAPGSAEGQKLAVSIQRSLKELVDSNNKREALVKKEPIIILKNVKTTTAIVECGFLSNSEEEKKLASKEYQDKLAMGIAEGIKRYFDNKK